MIFVAIVHISLYYMFIFSTLYHVFIFLFSHVLILYGRYFKISIFIATGYRKQIIVFYSLFKIYNHL